MSRLVWAVLLLAASLMLNVIFAIEVYLTHQEMDHCPSQATYKGFCLPKQNVHLDSERRAAQ